MAAEPFLKGPERSCSGGPLTAGRKMVSGAEGGTAGLGGLAGPSRLPAAAGTTPRRGPPVGTWPQWTGVWPLWSPRRDGLDPRGGVGGERLGSRLHSALAQASFCLPLPVSRCIEPYSCFLQVEAIGTHVTGGSMVSPVSNCQRFSFAASWSVASVLLDYGPQA